MSITESSDSDVKSRSPRCHLVVDEDSMIKSAMKKFIHVSFQLPKEHADPSVILSLAPYRHVVISGTHLQLSEAKHVKCFAKDTLSKQ